MYILLLLSHIILKRLQRLFFKNVIEFRKESGSYLTAENILVTTK